MEYLRVFIVGGTICLIGQILIDKTKMTPGKILVVFVVSGAVLSGLGIYQPIVDFGGAGATIPLVGFGHSLAQGAIKATEDQGLLGAFTGGITRTSAGVTAAIVFGYIMAVLFKPGSKK